MWHKLGKKQKGVIIIGVSFWALIVILSIENYAALGEISAAIRDIYRDPFTGSTKLKEVLALVGTTAAVAGIIISAAVFFVSGDDD